MKMMRNRVWSVEDRNYTPDELAETLTHHVWCRCTGFRCGRAFWLNVSSPDGVQEYIVVIDNGDDHELVVVETVTVSWCTEAKLAEYAEKFQTLTSGFATIRRDQIEPSSGHRCWACA